MTANTSNCLRKYTCVILCGGQSLRTRFALNGLNKLLAPINNTPLLHHVLDVYHSVGLFNKLILCLGGESSVFRDSIFGSPNYRNCKWKGIDLVMLDTGANVTATERISQSLMLIDDYMFFLTYGDILSNIDFKEIISQHIDTKSQITMAIVKAKMPYGRVLSDENGRVYGFVEKPILEDWINAGYFVLNKAVFQDVDTSLEYERELLPKFIETKDILMSSYKHYGYWKGIDTYKDLVEVQGEWGNINILSSGSF